MDSNSFTEVLSREYLDFLRKNSHYYLRKNTNYRNRLHNFFLLKILCALACVKNMLYLCARFRKYMS